MTSQRGTIISCLVFLLASCVATSANWAAESASDDALSLAAIQQRIQQYRTAEATVTIVAADGKPLANSPVVVRQVRHQFLFGCNGFGINTGNTSANQKAYQERFAALMNFATLGFYWGAYEPVEGQPAFERLGMMAKWCGENGVVAKGHPLCWQQVAPRWTLNKPMDELLKSQLGRITRDVGHFKGAIDTWDVINETVSMPDYKGETTPIPALCKQVGRLELIKQVFAAARAANPQARLVLNDYDTSVKYEKLVQECLDAGVSFDVIGIQSHQHNKYWGAKQAWDVCQRFGKFGKPLNFTETTIISADPVKNLDYSGRTRQAWPSTPEGEARQAQQVAEFYTILFSHPAVMAITWWDFSDSGAWLGAPSGLVRRDMSPKPAYDALMKLVKGEWWTKEVKAKTDGEGKITFHGFLGEYAVEAGPAKGNLKLEMPGQAKATVVMK